MTFSLSVDEIVSTTKLEPSLIAAFVEGASKARLHDMLAEYYNEPADSPVVDVARMNAVGTLRSVGYIVTGGRAGGDEYKIVGWEQKPEYIPADQWTGSRRVWLDEYSELPDVSFAEIQTRLFAQARRFTTHREGAYHETSPMYLRCYEMARDTGKYYKGTSGACVILRRFTTMPRFRIFNLSMTDAGELLDLASIYSKIGLSAVRILNVVPTLADNLIYARPKGSIEFRREAVYRTDRIANSPEQVFNKRAMTTLRKLEREMTWDRVTGSDDDTKSEMKLIITRWREINEKKQRQLAITRDVVAVDEFDRFSTSLTFIGRRHDEPVCMHILDTLSGYSNTVAQIVEKSINYKSQPGGTYGVADYNLYMTCHFLVRLGIEYLNAGAFEGGGAGLPQHKERFCLPEDVVKHITFNPLYPHLDRKELIVT